VRISDHLTDDPKDVKSRRSTPPTYFPRSIRFIYRCLPSIYRSGRIRFYYLKTRLWSSSCSGAVTFGDGPIVFCLDLEADPGARRLFFIWQLRFLDSILDRTPSDDGGQAAFGENALAERIAKRRESKGVILNIHYYHDFIFLFGNPRSGFERNAGANSEANARLIALQPRLNASLQRSSAREVARNQTTLSPEVWHHITPEI
jgi:hypothetical protein